MGKATGQPKAGKRVRRYVAWMDAGDLELLEQIAATTVYPLGRLLGDVIHLWLQRPGNTAALTAELQRRFDTALPAEYDRQRPVVEVRLAILKRWAAATRAAGLGSREAATDQLLSALAREGIKTSRPTLYCWLARFRKMGPAGLVDRRVTQALGAVERGRSKVV
jgi:hypothetical protein